MVNYHKRIVNGLVLTTILVAYLICSICLAAGKASAFVRLQFGNDAYIEVPSNWTFLEESIRQNLNTYSEAVVKLSGIDINQGDNQILIAANAYTTDKKPSASVRLSVRVGHFPSQIEIESDNPSELHLEAESVLRQLQDFHSDDVVNIKLLKTHVERLGVLYAIVNDIQVDYPYGSYQDRLDIIYLGDKVYKLYTSYKKSEAGLFEPIIRYVRKSFTVSSGLSHAERYCTEERMNGMTYLINMLKTAIKKPLEKDLANMLLQKIPDSKPYIKDDEYLGQLIMNEGISIGVIFFAFEDGYTSTSTLAMGPMSKENHQYIWQCFVTAASRIGHEIRNNVYDVGDEVAVDIYMPASDTVSAQAFRIQR